jgi:aldose 1-epimerase
MLTADPIPWGSLNGASIERFELENASLRVVLSNLGARLIGVESADREGRFGEITLGYDNAAGYLVDRCYLGATIGRYCNRLAAGRFALDGEQYQVPLNNGPNSLHGGPRGFDTKIWKAELLDDGVRFGLVSGDGDMGFPGELRANVTFRLAGQTLRLEYSAESTHDTVVALTNHAYFNLTADPARQIVDHVLMCPASAYTPVNSDLIPTGTLRHVEDSAFDFRTAKPIGEAIDTADPQVALGHGYDHNFVLKTINSPQMILAAEVYEPTTGRTLSVHTTEPGLQVYSGNFLDATARGRGGVPLAYRTGFCLETQRFPNSPNEPAFPSAVLHAGEMYTSTTELTFGVRS